MSAFEIHGLTRQISSRMYDKYGIIMTVGVYAVYTGDTECSELQKNIMETLSTHKEIVQVHGFYYSKNEKLSVSGCCA